MAPWAPIVVHIGAGIGLIREATKHHLRPLLGSGAEIGSKTWSEGGDRKLEIAPVDQEIGTRQDPARLDGYCESDGKVPEGVEEDTAYLAGIDERDSSLGFAAPEEKSRFVDSEQDTIRSIESDMLVQFI